MKVIKIERNFSMEYISAKEAAKKWRISKRRVQKLCEEGRIDGVTKVGMVWAIPVFADKPKDNRKKQDRL